MFICPKCKTKFDLPKCSCSYNVPQINSIYQFCEDVPVKLKGENKYIGYDDIGDDFEPAVTYWDTNNVERYGVYEACSDLVVKKFGTDIIILDLGAGLGTASIPLAKKGIYTIASDISNVMLGTAVKRVSGKYRNLIFARMNAYELPLADHSIDIVIENAMLHLVDNPEKVVCEMVRVLKPGGCLMRYGSLGQAMTSDEKAINKHANEVLSDIEEFYHKRIKKHEMKEIWFDNHLHAVILKHFQTAYNEVADFSEVFTDKIKFRLHRLRTGALSGFQSIPKSILKKTWEETDVYAKKKYGDDYVNIKSFSRYGAILNIYRVKQHIYFADL